MFLPLSSWVSDVAGPFTDGRMSHLVVIEILGGGQLHPELRPDPEDRQHDANDGHKERQLDLQTGEEVK